MEGVVGLNLGFNFLYYKNSFGNKNKIDFDERVKCKNWLFFEFPISHDCC